MGFTPLFVDLPVDSQGYRYVNQASWDALLGNFTGWQDNVSANGHNLASVNLLSATKVSAPTVETYTAASNQTSITPGVIYLRGNDDGVSWRNAISFLRHTDGAMQHSIGSEPAAGNRMFIHAGAGGGATSELRIVGKVLLQSGVLGVGTLAPNFALSFGSMAQPKQLALYDVAGEFYGFGIGAGEIRYDAGNAGRHSFYTNTGVEAMRVTSDGRLVTFKKRNQFGVHGGVAANVSGLLSSDCNMLVYESDPAGGNWAGIGADGGGNLWFRVGLSGSAAACMYFNSTTGSAVFRDDTWNGGHPIIGRFHLWYDSAGRLRTKNGAPTSDTDGQLVGTQV